MAKRPFGAVAVDLGATSGRFAAGWLVDGRIEFELVRQRPHAPTERNGVLFWDLDALLSIVREAVDYAASAFESSTIGIDAWGVDHGFLNRDGSLLQPPICYRDASHVAAFEKLKPHRRRLYELTGCQHQPFNTICQLVARSTERSDLPMETERWLVLPDLVAFLLTGERNYELTQASTTQLLGLDDCWSGEAFDIAGWPLPDRQPAAPGLLSGEVAPGVRLALVGSHDTASAVAGFGVLAPDEMFLNVGTWSLAGIVLPAPIATREAEDAGFTNERTVDGQVRFLKNIPGFWVINRLHDELGIGDSVPDWLSRANLDVTQRIDLFDPSLFNPESMLQACRNLIGQDAEDWAAVALLSLADAIADQPATIRELTGQKVGAIRVGGGGSQSLAFCHALAKASGLPVRAGPAEATVLGNLGMQFLASGHFADHAAMRTAILDSAGVQRCRPGVPA